MGQPFLWFNVVKFRMQVAVEKNTKVVNLFAYPKSLQGFNINSPGRNPGYLK